MRDRRRLVRHRGSEGAAHPGHPVRLLREVRPSRRQLGLPQHQRDVVLLPLAAHQHVAQADGVLGLPDAGVLSAVPASHPHRGVLRRYVDHLGLREKITFNTGVAHAAKHEDGWAVTLEGGEQRRYDALLVANGHHWDARWPEPAFPGADQFAGVQMHSHDYKGEDAMFFRDKRVVVLGMGNSAMDIAVEASFSAEKVFLAARRGAYVIPKWVFGRPLDQIGTAPKVPFKVRQKIAAGILRASVGDMERYGLPKPDHGILEAHPTVSDDVLSRIGHGEITPKPNIERLTERSVVFVDGSEEPADIVVYCTGYKVSFPFFDAGFISAPDNDLPLYRRVFHPDVHGLYFIALLQPLGATMPLAEAQSEWACDHLQGRYQLPSKAEMLADMERERTAMRRRYVASKRHTMQVDYDDYMFDLKRERRRGASRASASLA